MESAAPLRCDEESECAELSAGKWRAPESTPSSVQPDPPAFSISHPAATSQPSFTIPITTTRPTQQGPASR